MDSRIAAQQLRRLFAIAKKDLRVYYSQGPVVIFGVLMPAFLFLAFSIGREMSADFLLLGMLAVTAFFTASAVSPTVAPWETQARTLERLISSPVSVWTILLGDIDVTVMDKSTFPISCLADESLSEAETNDIANSITSMNVAAAKPSSPERRAYGHHSYHH